MQKHTFLPHTGDIRFSAEADTFEELLLASAVALCDSVMGLEKVRKKISMEIKVSAKGEEALLHRFLEEVLFKIVSENVVFGAFEIRVEKEKNGLKCIAKCWGEPVGKRAREIKVEVKAVTYNQFFVKKEGNKWKAQVVLDI